MVEEENTEDDVTDITSPIPEVSQPIPETIIAAQVPLEGAPGTTTTHIDTTAKPLPKRKAMAITIRDRAVLYAAYMSLLKYGGLFIPTKKSFTMSELCSLVLTLPGDNDKYSTNGKVVWITPPGAPGNKAGGIEFADDRDGDKVRRRIEEILGPLLQSNNATHTMYSNQWPKETIMYSDSHCHLQLIDYDKLGIDMDAAVQNALDNKVNHLLCIATHVDQNNELRNIAAKYPSVKISVGLHPNDEVAIEPTVADLVTAAAHPSVVAIGETGLDYYRTPAATPWQQDRFRTHIRAAKECNKALIVHTRDAKEDTLKILKEEKSNPGVLHCFSGDLDMALRAIDLGFYISFSGVVTFKNATQLQDVARNLPLEKILIETDCPFLTPEPMRGKMNQPANVRYVAEFLAKLRGEELDIFAKQTTFNYIKLFLE